MTRLWVVWAKIWKLSAGFEADFIDVASLAFLTVQIEYFLLDTVKLELCLFLFGLVGFLVVGRHHSEWPVFWGKVF